MELVWLSLSDVTHNNANKKVKNLNPLIKISNLLLEFMFMKLNGPIVQE
jgi:hypothetical protein